MIWETSKSTSIGDIRRADSNYYRAVTAGKTGTLRPSHTEGTSWDGWGGSGDDDTGIEWEYLHSGFGIARITAANGTTATAEVISYIPSQVVGEDNASYKWAKYTWNSVNGYPGTVVYYQQRLYFAASTAFPQTIWASRTGDYKDFGKSNPTQDDDRIIYTYAGRQVNEIRHLIDVGSLVALTSGGEYVITGDQNKVLTPSSFAFSSQGSNGSSNVPPIAVANIALFVQEKGSVVRDLAYSFDVDGYQGNDLTILANHLFQKHSIVDWCFSIVPYSSAFCIRDDGKLLVMTYLRDQQVFAWAPQSSTGKYESTCSISEGNEDAVYFVVNRTVNGQTVRYIERLSSRLFTSDEDAFFVDSGLSYDGRNTSDRTMTITGGSGEWDYRAEYTISISGGAYFTSSDVGAQLQFPYSGKALSRARSDKQARLRDIDQRIRQAQERLEFSRNALAPHEPGGQFFEARAELARRQQAESELNAQAVSFYKTAEVRTPDEVAPFEPGKILQQTEQKMMADPAGDIDLRIAEDSLLESPDMIITVLDDDGNPQSRSAREVLDEANRESEQAIQDSSLFDVAVACFLRG